MESVAVPPPPKLEPKADRPLLPPVLLGSAALLWLWVLPIAVLLGLNLQGFWLIEGEMNFEQRQRAWLLGLSGIVNLLFGVAFWLAAKSRFDVLAAARAALPRSIAMLAVQVAYLWLAMSSLDSMLPRTVTMWIYPPQRFLFNQFAFAMLPLFTGILQLACTRSTGGDKKTISLHLVLAVAAPVAFYVFANVLRSIDAIGGSEDVILASGAVVMGLVMFFALARALLFVLRSSAQLWSGNGQRWAIVLFALVFPAAGLLLNRTIPFPVDFQTWEVYALVVANTAILLFASWQHASRPRLTFGLLCATFPFSLYFFIVFLPYTPLSIVAVIVMGAGFLVLSPTLLFVLHLHLLNQARTHPRLHARPLQLIALGVACALLLPGFFTMRAIADKVALNAALEHVYTPAIGSSGVAYSGTRTNLRRALDSHRSYKNGLYYPLLSDYYSWLVFDRLVLPDDKLARLESIFFGSESSIDKESARRSSRSSFLGPSRVRDRSLMPRAVPTPHTVEVADLVTSVRPTGDENTVVTLALTLRNTGTAAAEYIKALPLPAGVFVSGFRLHVAGVAVPGRIFEKKTALWVYTMIRDSERRDPGLLFYNSPDELELRVFPIDARTPARVEIDFLVPGTLELASASSDSRDPAAVLNDLGRLLRPHLAVGPRGGYLAGGLERLGLPPVEREPYLHVIVDRSADNGYAGDLATALRELRQRFPAARRARITLANADVAELITPLIPLDELASRDWSRVNQVWPASGGFALDLVLAHAIRQHRDYELDRPSQAGRVPPRPIFVILSRTVRSRELEFEFTDDWADLLPHLELHELGNDGTYLKQRDARQPLAPLLRFGDSVRPVVSKRPVRFAPIRGAQKLEAWWPAFSEWRPVSEITTPTVPTVWTRAATLQLQQQDSARSPGDSDVDLTTLVQASRESGILLAATSYIVVENSAQWRMLETSERQKLGQNTALEFREAPAPPALLLAGGFLLWLGWRRRQRIVTRGRSELTACGAQLRIPRSTAPAGVRASAPVSR